MPTPTSPPTTAPTTAYSQPSSESAATWRLRRRPLARRMPIERARSRTSMSTVRTSSRMPPSTLKSPNARNSSVKRRLRAVRVGEQQLLHRLDLRGEPGRRRRAGERTRPRSAARRTAPAPVGDREHRDRLRLARSSVGLAQHRLDRARRHEEIERETPEASASRGASPATPRRGTTRSIVNVRDTP